MVKVESTVGKKALLELDLKEEEIKGEDILNLVFSELSKLSELEITGSGFTLVDKTTRKLILPEEKYTLKPDSTLYIIPHTYGG